MADEREESYERPEGYRAPNFGEVRILATQLKEERQAKLDKISATKRAIRGNWDDVLQKIPRAYRKTQPEVDLPEVRDMLRRIAGRIAKQEPRIEVTPPSGRVEDVRSASKEEARLHALRITIEDQQDESLYGLGVDSQCAWGESWISVWPDPTVFTKEFARDADEPAKDYNERYGRLMAAGRVPICMEVHDPQTVLPRMSRNRLALVIFESEHTTLDINLGLGYHPVKDTEGKTKEWVKATLSEPYVSQDLLMDTRIVDTTHDSGTTNTGGPPGVRVKSHIFVDPWCYQRYLDGVLVEEWMHDYGYVPVFPAWGVQSSDRDPEYHSVGIVDTALVVARQIIFFSAMLASNAIQHGWPTPFLKNPEHGLVHGVTGKPLTREIHLGEVNLLGPAEELDFPFLKASMMPDFFRYMDLLTKSFEGSTLGSMGTQLNSDTSGYAVAQVRALQDSILGPLYKSTARQWRKINYFFRHLIRTTYPDGIHLRGAVETVEVEGKEVQYRPVLEYAKKHTTDFSIEAHIDEGIVQDEIAERKSALEMYQAGVWSLRRVMEMTGVEDPVQEGEELSVTRLLNSPAADQVTLQMAMALAAERYQYTQQDQSSPFFQELQKAQQAMLGGQNQPGQPANQESAPNNALPGGQPAAQNPPPATPLEGGPTTGPGPTTGTNLNDMGVPQMPGGVQGGQMMPAGVG